MDDVRLFDRALSQDEINMLVHEPSYSLCWIE